MSITKNPMRRSEFLLRYWDPYNLNDPTDDQWAQIRHYLVTDTCAHLFDNHDPAVIAAVIRLEAVRGHEAHGQVRITP